MKKASLQLSVRSLAIIMILGFASASIAKMLVKSPRASGKQETLRGPASEKPRANEKANGQFNVEIESLEAPASEAGAPVRLRATISSKMDVNEVYFAWNLPRGVTASVPVEGSIGGLQAHEEKTIEFVGTSDSAENQQIHLHVFRKVGGQAMGKMTQYNTKDQERIERTLQTKAEMLETQAAESNQQLKVIQ